MTEYGAVILAAGAGSRLAKGCPPGPWLPGAGGVAKALLAVRGGRTFLATILASAGEVGHGQAIVVVGPPHGDAVALHAHELGARTVVNAHPERGMASSIALGFAAIAETSCEAAWLWPVDHPDVAVATLRELITTLGTHDAARPVHAGHRGHPPLIARALFDRLARCSDDGARAVLAAADVVDVAVDDPGCLRDVDTAHDLGAM